jgi:DNA (cytosine-5)-methyltransferase 1
MGLPQARTRIFFIARRDDLGLKPIKISFNEKPITFGEVEDWLVNIKKDRRPITNRKVLHFWKKSKPGRLLVNAYEEETNKRALFNYSRESKHKPVRTMLAGAGALHHSEPAYLSIPEWLACSSFPMDYDFSADKRDPRWFMGMSVPPFMIQRIALQIAKQWSLKNV